MAEVCHALTHILNNSGIVVSPPLNHGAWAATVYSAAGLWYNEIMSTISVQDIQRDPRAFLRRIEAGESFLVVNGQRPLAEIRPVPVAAAQPRPFGLCAGRFTVPADFDHPLPEQILREFEGA
jgi:antitoxin (DNA-binding transcriptional repressor) of toxin-antitoxin stability system